jgi:hypothetical protein
MGESIADQEASRRISVAATGSLVCVEGQAIKRAKNQVTKTQNAICIAIAQSQFWIRLGPE